MKFGGLPFLSSLAEKLTRNPNNLSIFWTKETRSNMEFVPLLFCVLSVFITFIAQRFVVLATFSQAMDSDFTFTLPAGRKECFYQTMKKDASLEIEYQVRQCNRVVKCTGHCLKLMQLFFYTECAKLESRSAIYAQSRLYLPYPPAFFKFQLPLTNFGMMSKFVDNLFIKFDSPLVNVFTVRGCVKCFLYLG